MTHDSQTAGIYIDPHPQPSHVLGLYRCYWTPVIVIYIIKFQLDAAVVDAGSPCGLEQVPHSWQCTLGCSTHHISSY